MRIERQDLPGIGTLHVFTTRAGQRIGVIRRRDGLRTLALYRDDDPQTVHRAATFDPDEAHHLVDLLHPILTVNHVDPDSGQPCLVRLRVLSGSPVVGQSVAAVQAPSTRVLAIVRDGRLLGWPPPETVLRDADTLVAAGTVEGIDALARQFEADPDSPDYDPRR